MERAADAELRRYYRWEPQRRWLTRWRAALAGTRAPNAPVPARALEPWEIDALAATLPPVSEDLRAWEVLAGHWLMRWRHAEETWADLVVRSRTSV